MLKQKYRTVKNSVNQEVVDLHKYSRSCWPASKCMQQEKWKLVQKCRSVKKCSSAEKCRSAGIKDQYKNAVLQEVKISLKMKFCS